MKKWQEIWTLETGEENSVHFEVSIDDLYDHDFFTIEPEKSVIESESERLKKINLWEPILCKRAGDKFEIISGHLRKRILKHRGITKTLIRVIDERKVSLSIDGHLQIMKEENLDQWERDEKITFIKKFFALEILDRVKSGHAKKGEEPRESLSKRIERASLGRIAKGTADRLLAEIRSQEERTEEEKERSIKMGGLRKFIDRNEEQIQAERDLRLSEFLNFSEKEKAIAQKRFELAQGWEKGTPLSDKTKIFLRNPAFEEMIWKEMDFSSKEDMDSLLFFRKTFKDSYRFNILEEEIEDIEKKIWELKDRLKKKKTDLLEIAIDLEESFTQDRFKKLETMIEKKSHLEKGRKLLFGVFGALYSPKIKGFFELLEILVPDSLLMPKRGQSPPKKKK